MTAYNMKRSRSTCHSVSLSLNLPICSSASAKNTNPIREDIRVDWCIVRRSGWRQFSNNSFIRSSLGESRDFCCDSRGCFKRLLSSPNIPNGLLYLTWDVRFNLGIRLRELWLQELLFLIFRLPDFSFSWRSMINHKSTMFPISNAIFIISFHFQISSLF